MTIYDIYELKESKEYKASSALEDAVNDMCFDCEKFAQSIRLMHPTLQQKTMKAMVETIKYMATADIPTDGRNQRAVALAKDIVATGVLDEAYLPCI